MLVAIIMIILAVIITFNHEDCRKHTPRVPSELHARDRYEMTRQLEESSNQIFMNNHL